MVFVYNLYFGNYGGVLVELVYMVFGFVLCGIIVIGILFWL